MKTRAKNVIHSTGPGAFVMQDVRDVKIHFAEKRQPKMDYPFGALVTPFCLRTSRISSRLQHISYPLVDLTNSLIFCNARLKPPFLVNEIALAATVITKPLMSSS